MRKLMLLTTVLAGSAVLAFAANAGPISVRLTSGSTIQNFGPSTTGSLLFNTSSFANFSLISGTVTGAGQGNNSTLLDLNSLQVATTTGAPLQIAVTETGLTSMNTGFVSAIGGTFTSGNGLMFQTYIDAGNAAFATTSLLGSSTFNTGINFSNNFAANGVALPGLFSETIILTLTPRSGSTTSFDANVSQNVPAAVPEPFSLALLGTGLATFGVFRARSRKA